MSSNRNSHLLIMDMQNSKALLENSLSISYRVKHRLWPKWYFFLSRYFPKRFEILLTKKSCTSIVVTVVQSLSHVQLFVTPRTAAWQASLSFTSFQSLLKLMCIESVMLFNNLILCCPLLLLPSIFPSIKVFSNDLALCIRWPKYWHFSLNISPSKHIENCFHLGWTVWLSMGLTRVFSNTIVQKHQFFGVQPSLCSNSHIHTWLLAKP